MSSQQTMTFTDVQGAGLSDWRYLHTALHARFATGDFAAGLVLVNRIGDLAEAASHHPDVDLRYPRVRVSLTSHDSGGVTSRDVDLARQISAAAAELGMAAEPSRLTLLEIGLDTADQGAIEPFWRAVLGLDDGNGDDLTPLWFQQTEPHAPPRQRFHLDITVTPEVARQRVDAALAAGGTLVSEDAAPAFIVLADAEGNQACICTAAGRD